MLKSHFHAPENATYLDTAYCGLIHEKAQNHSFHSAKIYQKAPSETRAQLYGEVIPHIKTLFGKFLGAKKENIALTGSFSSGFNTLLSNLPEGKILYNEDDYPSLRYPLQHGRFNKVTTNGVSPWKHEQQELERDFIIPEPKYYAVSLVHYNSGLVTDIKQVAELCKKHNVMSLIDGTQGLIVNPVELNKWGVDAYIASCYKWCWGGYGNGVVAISDAKLTSMEHNTCNNNNTVLQGRNMVYVPSIASLEPGHFDHESFFRLEKALGLIESYGLSRIVDEVSSLSATAMEFAQANNIQFVSQDAGPLNNIFCLPHSDSLVAAIKENNIMCSVRGNSVRFSVHAYNNEQDLNQLFKAIQQAQI